MSKYLYSLPELPHFAEYLIQPGLFTAEEVGKIQSYYAITPQEPAVIDRELKPDEQSIRKSTVAFLPPSSEYLWVFERIARWAYQINSQYLGFDLQGLNEGLQLARYGVDDYFDWHLDFGPNHNSTRKLSISVQITDPAEYEGGNLEIMINGKSHVMPKEPGTAILFPSFIQHRVTSIIRGSRYSLVGWVNGKPFR